MAKEKQYVYQVKKYITQDMQIAIQYTRHTPKDFTVFENKLYKREFWKITYIVSGCGILKINNRRYPVTPGFVCLIHPDDLTTMELTEDIILYNVLFLDKLIAPDLKKLYSSYDFFSLFDPDFKPEKSLNHYNLHLLNSNRNILAIIRKMFHEYQYQDVNTKELLRFQLLELLINLARLSNSLFAKRRRDNIVDFVTSYMCEHYQKPLSISQIANEFGISKGYLFSFYRKHAGETIGRKLLKIRLAKAKELLTETNMKIESLCYYCGFSDLCNFYKVFKRESGCSPGKYRKNNGPE